MTTPIPTTDTIGALRASGYTPRSVSDELRGNLIGQIKAHVLHDRRIDIHDSRIALCGRNHTRSIAGDPDGALSFGLTTVALAI